MMWHEENFGQNYAVKTTFRNDIIILTSMMTHEHLDKIVMHAEERRAHPHMNDVELNSATLNYACCIGVLTACVASRSAAHQSLFHKCLYKCICETIESHSDNNTSTLVHLAFVN